MNDIKILKLFPTPVFHCKVDDYVNLNNELEKYIYNLRKKDETGLKVSNGGGGWHSPMFKISESEILKKYCHKISKHLYEITTKHYAWDCKIEHIQFEAMWSIINSKNSYNLRHFHPNCHLSAAYYVKAKENCGKIKFFHPVDAKVINSPPKKKIVDISAEAININPNEGDLLVFPSYLHHSVEENLSGEDRIVISFNISIDKNYK